MNIKRKLIKSILSTISLVLVGVFAIILPIYMQNAQNKASAENYKAYGVSAVVSGNYYVGQDSFKMYSGESDKIVFDAYDEQSSPALDPTADIKLTSRDKFVVFEYIFKNNSNKVSFITQFSNIIETQNMNVTYGYSYKQLKSFETVNKQSLDNIPVIYKSDNKLYVYIKVEIDDLNKQSLLSGKFCFNLIAEEVYEIILEDGTSVKKAYATLGYVPCAVDVPSYAGLKFEGYFTEREGQGRQVFDENGQAAEIWAQAEGDVLYSYYTRAF